MQIYFNHLIFVLFNVINETLNKIVNIKFDIFYWKGYNFIREVPGLNALGVVL